MALIQISDPEIKTEIKRKFSVGIDLGTTHSLIAERVNNKITIFEDNGSSLIPSIVSEVEGNLVMQVFIRQKVMHFVQKKFCKLCIMTQYIWHRQGGSRHVR